MKYYNLIILLLILSWSACSERGKQPTEQTVEEVLPEENSKVTVIPLQETDFHQELISNGKLSARQQAELRFESAEPIAAIFVKNGDRVLKGQKLAQLSTFRLNNKTIQAKDALDRAKLELQDVLIGQGYLLADSANVPHATMQLVKTKSGYDQALIQYQLAQYEEQRAVLRAPFEGVVANLSAKPHNIASLSEAFCTIIDNRSLEASFSVLESELPLIKVGNLVEVTSFASPEIKAEGRITEINPLVDANGMVQVKSSVADTDRLFEGMNIRVSIHRSVENQLVIPKTAVVLRSGRQVVFTLIDGKAYWNYVQTGQENADSYTITDGLKPGDIVITGGNINLAHETPVSVENGQLTVDSSNSAKN